MALRTLTGGFIAELLRGLSSSPGINIVFVCFLSLLVWRLWRFTILPRLYPHRVKELPYWIPVIGHTVSFFRDAPAVVDAGVRMTGDGGEPFAVQLLGVKNYFIIRPSEITQAFRNMTTLSFDRFMDDYLCCFGVKKEDVPVMNADMIKLDRNLSETTAYPAEGHDMKKFIEWTYKRQLAVDKVTELWLTYFAAVQETTSFKTLQARSSTTNGKGVVEIDLRGLLSCTLTVSVTRMLFGTKLIEIEPNMPKHVHGFIDGLWKLVYRYPRWAIGHDLARDHDATLAALEKYAKFSSSEQSDASWLLRTVIEGQNQSRMEKRSKAALLSVIYLAALANVHATIYWLLCYVLTDQSLRSAIEKEIAPAFSDGVMDAFHIAEKCPLLGSAFQEVLRLHITSNGVRYVEQPTTFGEKILGAGHQLMIPLRQLNHSESIWGTDRDRFDPERFLKNKTLASHTAFRPFGGGINLCPGKSFASRQVLSYVAYLLYTLDISLPPRKGVPQQFPLKEHETLAFGVSVPKRGMDLELELRASKNAPIREVKMVIPGAPDDKL